MKETDIPLDQIPKETELPLTPEANANFLSILSYTWLDPIFRVGWKRPVEQTDLWLLQDKWLVKIQCDLFEECWDREKTRAKNSNTPVKLHNAVWNFMFWYALHNMMRVYKVHRKLAPAGVLRLVNDFSNISQPFLVKALVNFIVDSKKNTIDPPPLSSGYYYIHYSALIPIRFAYAIGIFLLQLTATIAFNMFFQQCSRHGLSCRSALVSCAYKKSLLLSSKARQSFSQGKVTNMISSDASRVELFMTFVHTIWTAPLQIVIVFIFLILQLGYGAVAGVGLLLLLTPLQSFLWRKLATIRKETASMTDARIKTTQEVLQGIRVIKFFSWEIPYISKIDDIRKKEISFIKRKGFVQAFVTTIAFSIPIICASLAFVIYSLTSPLDPGTVFASLTWFYLLRFPLMFLPAVISGLADYKVAINRYQEFFLAEELDSPLVKESKLDTMAVKMDDADFLWDFQSSTEASNLDEKSQKQNEKQNEFFKLSDVSLAIPKGSLVAVIGAVGSGKSSLLSGILGEMKKVKGAVDVQGSIGYCPQQAWIQNGSLRDNILFGRPFDKDKYYKVLRDCALEPDLKLLPDGDKTQIGERGINLSGRLGGQKQRVNLARMTYFNSDVLLLDDPLSAVDAHVGKYLFENCILKSLEGKTRILVTHQLHVLPKVDYIIVFKQGRIVEKGTFQDLMKNGEAFSELMKSYGGLDGSEGSSSDSDLHKSTLTASQQDLKDKKDMERVDGLLKKGKDARELMSTEERVLGRVVGKVWQSYFTAAGGQFFFAGLILALIFVQFARVGNDFWLVIWTNQSIPGFSDGQYIGVFWVWSIGQALAIYALSCFFTISGARASRILHEAALKRVLNSPISFFDTTPLGRIINRFSKDLDGIDNQLPEAFRMFSLTFATAISTFALIIYATPLFATGLVPVGICYFYVQWVYRMTSRELKRLDSISRSPFYAHFSESLTGLPTIRAYGEQSHFISKNQELLDVNNRAYYYLFTAQRWLAVRLESLGAILVFLSATFGILARNSPSLTPALVGLSLTYAIQVTGTLNWCVRQFTETEIAMNAVERVDHYGFHIPMEEDESKAKLTLAKEWPSNGNIICENLSMRYAPDLPLVLSNVDFTINHKEKIGIVGRTGSGKSSMIQALFRMVEPETGSKLFIDGVDILQLNLKDLRSRLAIIPQDPILFGGSFRYNLDPFDEFTDVELWDALQRANLKEKIQSTENGLEGFVSEGGENLSVGQRQLLCLARAIVKKPKILFMDEATANVDYESDAIIQKCIRSDFGEATILTIAHRLNTIMDYDRILVFDAGKLVEYGSPSELLERPEGCFKSMVKETGSHNAQLLENMTKH